MENETAWTFWGYLLWSLPIALSAWAVIVGIMMAAGPLRKSYDADRAKWIIAQFDKSGAYATLMQRALNWLDARLSPSERENNASPLRLAYSANLASSCIALSVAYPLLSLFGQWLAGYPMAVANLPIAPAGTGYERSMVGASIALPSLFYGLALFSNSPQRDVFVILATLMLLGLAILLGPAFGTEVPGIRTEVAIAVAAASTVAVTVALAFAGGGAIAVALGPAVALAFLVSGAVAADLALVLSVAAALSFASAFAVGLAFAIKLTVGSLFHQRADKKGKTAEFKFLPNIILTLALVIVVTFLWSPIEGQESLAAYLVLFFAILPFLNSVFDFASFGLTRLLIQKGIENGAKRYFFADLCGAIIAFFLLGFTLIATIHWLRKPDGTALFDLQILFDGLHTSPDQFTWLAVMMYSTFLPTFLHLCISVFFAGMTSLHWLTKPTRTLVDNVSSGLSNASEPFAVMILTAMCIFAIWLPVTLIALLLSIDHGAINQGVISVFTWFAETIGAITARSP